MAVEVNTNKDDILELKLSGGSKGEMGSKGEEGQIGQKGDEGQMGSKGEVGDNGEKGKCFKQTIIYISQC